MPALSLILLSADVEQNQENIVKYDIQEQVQTELSWHTQDHIFTQKSSGNGKTVHAHCIHLDYY